MVGLALLVVAGLLSLPGVPGHDQAALGSQLAVSDAVGAWQKIDPFHHAEAASACAMLPSTFGVGNHLFKNSSIGWYASIWPSYQALEAMKVTSLRPGESACAGAVDDTVRAIDANYWDEDFGNWPAAFDQGPNPFHFRFDLPRVDDSLWMALAIMDDYAATGDRALLARAEAVFRLAVANWDPRRGGIYWEDHAPGATNDDKTVVSNAPAVVLGLELYAQTGQPAFRAWSERIFTWLEGNLFDPRTGLFDDSVGQGPPVRRPTTILTYDQGIVLEAMAALSRVDPTAYPLVRATTFAQVAMRYFAEHGSYGQPGFDAIWAEDVLWTASLEPGPPFAGAARASVQLAAEKDRGHAGDLLDTSSETTLGELAGLAPTSYGRLGPVLVKVRRA